MRKKKRKRETTCGRSCSPANNVVLSNGKFPRAHSYRHIWKEGLLLLLLVLLSRLANVASRSAICQTRLKICTVGSPVIIAEAYRWREKRITVRERGNKNERWRRNWDKREKKFNGDMERQGRKKETGRKRIESHWFIVVDSGRFFSSSKKEEPRSRNREKERQCCDAGRKLGRNFDGRSDDDDDEAGPPYFHELEEDTIANLREKSFRTDRVALTYIRRVCAQVTLFSFRSAR